MKYRTRALRLAAQAWCQEKTSAKVMDTDLAEAFANILETETRNLRRKLAKMRKTIERQAWNLMAQDLRRSKSAKPITKEHLLPATAQYEVNWRRVGMLEGLLEGITMRSDVPPDIKIKIKAAMRLEER